MSNLKRVAGRTIDVVFGSRPDIALKIKSRLKGMAQRTRHAVVPEEKETVDAVEMTVPVDPKTMLRID
ncbi:MAG: hypothetical protein K0U74_02180 [Alphaproteobacteria bacterium]|nr:hypothetical protein [Alphaproteobacteria bacterium]